MLAISTCQTKPESMQLAHKEAERDRDRDQIPTRTPLSLSISPTSLILTPLLLSLSLDTKKIVVKILLKYKPVWDTALCF